MGRVKKMEITQHARYSCPNCGKVSLVLSDGARAKSRGENKREDTWQDLLEKEQGRVERKGEEVARGAALRSHGVTLEEEWAEEVTQNAQEGSREKEIGQNVE